MKTILTLLIIILTLIISCNSNTDKKIKAKTDTVLMLNDIPYFDTTGKQSIFRNISPYEIKGIGQPESDDTDYDKPYNSFEFITNAYDQLNDMGFSGTGSIIEFSHKIQDTIWAKTIYDTLRMHSFKKYLGSRKNFTDSVIKTTKMLSIPVNHSDSALKSLRESEY